MPTYGGTMCESYTCNHGYCSKHGDCKSTRGLPTCECNPGYDGPRCNKTDLLGDSVKGPVHIGVIAVLAAFLLRNGVVPLFEK